MEAQPLAGVRKGGPSAQHSIQAVAKPLDRRRHYSSPTYGLDLVEAAAVREKHWRPSRARFHRDQRHGFRSGRHHEKQRAPVSGRPVGRPHMAGEENTALKARFSGLPPEFLTHAKVGARHYQHDVRMSRSDGGEGVQDKIRSLHLGEAAYKEDKCVR